MTVQLLEFEQHVAESGLLTAAEVQAFIESMPQEAKPLDASRLAQALVREKKLTPYQAQAIYLGKGSQLTLGNYVILSKLGKGGMGVVFKAMHRWMHRVVAIKVLSRTAVGVPSLAKRFKREIRAVALLEHPNIVTAYDADEAAGRLLLAMQYLDGKDLSTLVREQGPLPVSMAISCLMQTARGLEYAHSRGVVHRDVKPSNLFLGNDGILKILDMGLARVEHLQAKQQERGLTDTGLVMGSVGFMAPEQAADMRKSDARSDIYSLGCTLWYLLVGKEVYPGATPMERLVAHWDRPLPSLREVCPEVSFALESVFYKMVAKRPENRYQTMTEVLTELERVRISEAAAATHAPLKESEKVNEELTEFLQVLAGQASDRDVDNVRSSNRRPAKSSSAKPSREETARLSGSMLRRREATRNTRWHPTRKTAAWLGLSGLSVVLVIVGILVVSQNQGDPGSRPQHESGKVKPSIPGREVPMAGRNCVDLIDEQKWQKNDAWSVQNEENQMVLRGKGQGTDWLISKKSDYKDYILWLEYRLTDGADSGLFPRGRFAEVQIADSPKGRIGALLGDIEPSKILSSLGPDYDPFGWNQMVVQVQGNQVRVWIDKRLVTDTQCKAIPASGCLVLKTSPQEVSFRNIKIKESPLGTRKK